MGEGIAVDVGSHEAQEKASQKLALSIAIVKARSAFSLSPEKFPAVAGLASLSIALPCQLWGTRLV